VLDLQKERVAIEAVKGQLRAGHAALNAAVEAQYAAEGVRTKAEEELAFFTQHMLGTEVQSLQKLREEAEELKAQIVQVRSQMAVCQGLNAEIRGW
jgi:hypothetical protein